MLQFVYNKQVHAAAQAVKFGSLMAVTKKRPVVWNVTVYSLAGTQEQIYC